MGETKSKTERDTNLVERLTNDHHYKTTISDGKDRAEGIAKTPEKAEERASKQWENKK
jgi:hypothetical protein